jgi:hypothetical protein
MIYDKTTPAALKETQEWFASIITQPIDGDSRIPAIAPSGIAIEEEASRYICPSPTLRPAQRIELYAQQYWWRLLSALQEIYPLVTRLFGYHDFNCILAIPYLIAYPPDHWSLNLLGIHLAQWIHENYNSPDKQLVYDAALLDAAFHESFVAKASKPLEASANKTAEDLSYLLSCKLYLQPFIQFFEFEYDLMTFRVEFLKETPEYWVENDFPILKKEKTSFVLFRNLYGHTAWDTISSAELKLLSCFIEGSTIEEACDWLEKQDASIFKEAENNLHIWVQGWMIKKWLSPTL